MYSVYEISKKTYEERYYVEKITARSSNKEQIKEFDGGPNGKGLVENLIHFGWSETSSGNSSYYLVKDKETEQIAAYFSVKCGLLYEPFGYESLESDDRDFVDLLVEAIEQNNVQLLTDYKASGLYTVDKFTELYKNALEVIEAEKNKKESGSFDVKSTYSAIEVQNLCRNHLYSQPDDIRAPIGFQTFWFTIIPLIEKVASLVGCKYAYLFAADQSDSFHLVNYYKDRWGFVSLADLPLSVIRPKYDYQCIEMFASVENLLNSQKSIWNQYADVYGIYE